MADRQETLGSFRGDLLEEAVVQEFAADLRGELLRPEDDGYDTARAVFNGMIDRHPALIARCAVDGSFTLVDWSFVGAGALGEDIGNLVPDSVFDLFVPAEALPELDEAVFGGYVSGLREAGWQGDERLVRLGMHASAVKYEWLGPLMVQKASDAEHVGYGGSRAVDSGPLYAERAATLAFLVSWAEEARELAEELGYAR